MDRLGKEEKGKGGREREEEEEEEGSGKWQFKKGEGWTGENGVIFSVNIKVKLLLRQLILALESTWIRC